MRKTTKLYTQTIWGLIEVNSKEEEAKVQLEKPKSYSRFEKCIMLLIVKFFSKEKDINKFGEWLEEYLKGDD